MRMITLTSLTILFAACGFTGGTIAADIAVPAQKCNATRSIASPNGDAIAKDTTVPFVLDFTMVDSNKDGAVDADEFSKACSAGEVKADEATVNDMK